MRLRRAPAAPPAPAGAVAGAAHVSAEDRLASLTRPGRRRRMLVIANPHATTTSERLKTLVVCALQGRYGVDVVDTRRPGHAVELAREAADESYDVVVAFGGDGTINEVANGLAGSPTPLALLPGGATNVYCRMLGVPVDLVDATEHLLALADRWAPTRVDLGSVNGRWFTFAGGAGLDATVVERVDRHPALKARFGPWFFAQSAVATFLSRYATHPLHLRVQLGARRLRGVSVFVQNGPTYTYFKARRVDVAPGGIQTGLLAGAVLERAHPLDLPSIAFRALSRRFPLAAHRRVASFAGAHGLRVTSEDGRPVPLQVDGDYLGESDEVRFGVLPGGLGLVA